MHLGQRLTADLSPQLSRATHLRCLTTSPWRPVCRLLMEVVQLLLAPIVPFLGFTNAPAQLCALAVCLLVENVKFQSQSRKCRLRLP